MAILLGISVFLQPYAYAVNVKNILCIASKLSFFDRQVLNISQCLLFFVLYCSFAEKRMLAIIDFDLSF